jgi:hypothetical protein
LFEICFLTVSCASKTGGTMVCPTRLFTATSSSLVGPAQFAKSVQERCEADASFRIVCGQVYQHAMRRIRSGCCARAASG